MLNPRCLGDAYCLELALDPTSRWRAIWLLAAPRERKKRQILLDQIRNKISVQCTANVLENTFEN